MVRQCFESEVKIREQYMQWKEVVKTERDLRLRIHILDFSLLRKITSSGFRWWLCIVSLRAMTIV